MVDEQSVPQCCIIKKSWSHNVKKTKLRDPKVSAKCRSDKVRVRMDSLSHIYTVWKRRLIFQLKQCLFKEYND